MAFKVGDRVVRIGSDGAIPEGSKGVVNGTDGYSITVQWEAEVGDGVSLSQFYNLLTAHELVALESTAPAMTLSAACEAYTTACAHFESAQETLERAKAAVADARIMVERALEQEPAP